MKKISMAMVTVAFCFMLISSVGFAADTIKWRCHTILNANSGEVQNLMWFCDQVKQRTGGRLEISVFPGGALGIPVQELYRSLKAGVVEMAMDFPEFQQGDAPALSLDSRFYLWGNRSQRWAIHELINPLRKKILEEDWNIMLLGGFPLYNTLDGIVSNIDGSSWSDFKGKKIRVSAPDSKRVFELCGTSAVYMPLGETYQGLKTGVIDGVDTSPRSVVERSLNEVAKNYVNVGHPGTVLWSCEFYVGKRHWDKLPADIQKIVQECAADAARKGACESSDPRTEKVYLDKMKSSGMTIRYFAEDELEKTRQAAIKAFWEFMEGNKDPRVIQVFELIKPYVPQAAK